MSRGARFAATFATMFAAHHLGDYWIQTHAQARTKGDRTPAGRRACAAHVATYTAGSALAVAGVSAALDLRLSWRSQLLAQVISAGTHYWLDRRWTLDGLVNAIDPLTGKSTYLAEGGAPLLDQSAHLVCLAVASLVAARMDATP